MKNFLVVWIIFQMSVLTIANVSMDFNHKNLEQETRKIVCDSAGYYIGIGLIDVVIPLIIFTDLKVRDCQ